MLKCVQNTFKNDLKMATNTPFSIEIGDCEVEKSFLIQMYFFYVWWDKVPFLWNQE